MPNTTTPSQALSTAVAWTVLLSPSAPSSTDEARKAPAAAPSVLTKYRVLTERPTFPDRSVM